MSEPEVATATSKNGVKTMGIRYQPALHTQLSVIAQLRGRSFQDEVIAACEADVEDAKSDPELLSRLQAAIADIERDAASRRDALTSLFTSEEPPATPEDEQPIPIEQSRGGRSRSRRSNGADESSS